MALKTAVRSSALNSVECSHAGSVCPGDPTGLGVAAHHSMEAMGKDWQARRPGAPAQEANCPPDPGWEATRRSVTAHSDMGRSRPVHDRDGPRLWNPRDPASPDLAKTGIGAFDVVPEPASDQRSGLPAPF